MKTELVVDRSFPCGVQCLHCNKTAKIGQFVAYERRRLHDVPLVLLFHRECLKEIMESMPFDSDPELENINQQVVQALETMKKESCYV